jgi:outer membrane protein OmpA-like peptidoglycan-associated protein
MIHSDLLKIGMKLIFFAFLFVCGTVYSQTDRYEFSPACFNTTFDEYGVRLLNGKMYLVTASLDEQKQVILDEVAQRPFTDIYQLDGCTIQDAYLKNAQTQELWLVSSMHNDGAFTTNRYQSRVYFSHNNSEEIAYNMGLYYLNRQDSGWSNSVAFPLNSETYNIVHPFFDESTKLLYFSSNMPGGIGGYDIYSVAVLKDGFGAPELVQGVNSSFDDFYPYVHTNRIYFSSNRAGGQGGLDIFCFYPNGLTENLTINSSFDDFDLSFIDEQTGFFSTNRNSSGLHDDAFFFKFTAAQQYEVDELVFVDSTLNYKNERSEVLTNLLDQVGSPNILLNLAATSMRSLADSSALLQKELMVQTEQTYAQLNALLDTLNRQIVADAGADYALKMSALNEINRAIEALKTSNDPNEQAALLALIEKNLNLVNPALVDQNRRYIETLQSQLNIRNQKLLAQQSFNKQLSESSKLAFSEVLSLDNTPENQQLKADFSNFMYQTLYLDATSALKDSMNSIEKSQHTTLAAINQKVSSYLQTKTDADPLVLQKLDSLLSLLNKESDPTSKLNILKEINELLESADPQLKGLLEADLQQYHSQQQRLLVLQQDFATVIAKFTDDFKEQFIALALEASTLSKEELQKRIASLQNFAGIDLSSVFDPEVPVLSPELLATFLANHQPENILFGFDSYQLAATYHQSLNDLAKFAAKYKQFKIFLDGHTDIMGRASYNLRLSKNRANSVRTYLEAQGLNSSNFVISSFGFNKPVATNKTKEGRRLNRRVEIKLVSVQ